MLIKFKIVILLIICFLPLISTAQVMVFYDNNFEDCCDLVVLDTASTNIWQIGKPNKLGFDSAFTKPNAIVTDSIHPYPPNNLSFFTITINAPRPNFCWSSLSLTIYHKYNTDTLRSGGFIEISYNGGVTWTNIIYDKGDNLFTSNAHFYSETDTLINGMPAFSGNNSNDFNTHWQISEFRWNRYKESQYEINSAILKFCFVSDSTQTNKNGWLIDNISIQLNDNCWENIDAITRQNKVCISPNPLSDISIVKYNNLHNLNYTFKIYNTSGILVKEYIAQYSNTLELDKRDFISGLYIYQLINAEGYIETGKFIVE